MAIMVIMVINYGYDDYISIIHMIVFGANIGYVSFAWTSDIDIL